MRLFIGAVMLVVAATAGTTARTSEFLGDVRDPDGRPVPGATVGLTSSDAMVRKVVTDKAGTFHFSDLPRDTYRVIVSASGFKSWDLTFTVADGESVRTTFPLQLGSLIESMTVAVEPDRGAARSTPSAPSGSGRGGGASATPASAAASARTPRPLPSALPDPADRRPGGDVVSPQPRTKPAPVYPPAARAMGLSGSVFVEGTIGKDGKVAALQVAGRVITLASGEVSRTDVVFDQQVLSAIARWRYEPCRLNGRAVDVNLTAIVKFELRRPVR